MAEITVYKLPKSYCLCLLSCRQRQVNYRVRDLSWAWWLPECARSSEEGKTTRVSDTDHKSCILVNEIRLESLFATVQKKDTSKSSCTSSYVTTARIRTLVQDYLCAHAGSEPANPTTLSFAAISTATIKADGILMAQYLPKNW